LDDHDEGSIAMQITLPEQPPAVKLGLRTAHLILSAKPADKRGLVLLTLADRDRTAEAVVEISGAVFRRSYAATRVEVMRESGIDLHLGWLEHPRLCKADRDLDWAKVVYRATAAGEVSQ
jgi:hypothetical protein